jgi:hypothetical protein
MGRLQNLITSIKYSNDGGKWRNRWWAGKEHRLLCLKILAEAELIKYEQRIPIETYAGFLEDYWKHRGGNELRAALESKPNLAQFCYDEISVCRRAKPAM